MCGQAFRLACVRSPVSTAFHYVEGYWMQEFDKQEFICNE